MTDHTSGPNGPGADSPNPFSREGAEPGEQKAADAGTGPTETPPASSHPDQPSGATALPAAGADPAGSSDPYAYPPSDQPAPPPSAGSYGDPQPYGQPSANQPYSQPSAGSPYGQPSANAPYEQPPAYGQPADPYGQQPQPYGQPGAGQPYGQPSAIPPYEQPPTYDAQVGAYPSPGYDQTGYGVDPYQAGGYGYPGYSSGAMQHPQAVTALITGIVGAAICGPVGIAGLVLGRKVRNEIDADPQRYTGRGMGTAGFILGIIGIVATVVWVLIFVASLASGS